MIWPWMHFLLFVDTFIVCMHYIIISAIILHYNKALDAVFVVRRYFFS